ncbi:MAG: Methyltransferase domain protein [bacterium ADurb.BinA186]|nr:MAG: Methyltransferase domain protein [bacterium ADurb.BinA186]
MKPYLDKHKGSKPVNEGDWGSTFYELVAHDVDLLQQVARIYDARGERPLVLDLGCGYGFLAPLILAAGGQYHGVEQFENVAQIANKGIWATKTLWTQKDEDAKSLYKIKRASFIDTPLIEENKYDIIVLKNVLHFYSPSQCEQIITKVNRWLKKDGLVFAIADSPYREKEWLDYYQNNQASEIYPGFGVRNEPSIMHIYKFGQKYTRTEFLEANQGLAPNFSRLLVVKVPETTLASGQRFNGYLSEASEVIDNYTNEVTWETAIRASTNTQGQRATLISWTHQVFNFFTTEQMNNIFKRHGFETQEAYYVDSFGSKIEQATTYLQSKASIITRKK